MDPRYPPPSRSYPYPSVPPSPPPPHHFQQPPHLPPPAHPNHYSQYPSHPQQSTYQPHSHSRPPSHFDPFPPRPPELNHVPTDPHPAPPLPPRRFSAHHDHGLYFNPRPACEDQDQDRSRRARSESPLDELEDSSDERFMRLAPEQQLQISNSQKYTPSCSRCRQKKLKCDTKLPCNQCTAKGLQHECRKDARIPRGRKRPKLESSSQTQSKSEDEIASLKRRIKELENLVRNPSELENQSNTPPRSISARGPRAASSSSSSAVSSAAHILAAKKDASLSSAASTSVTSDFANEPRAVDTPASEEDEQEPSKTEGAVIVLEKLATCDPRISEPGHGSTASKKINHLGKRHLAPDQQNPHFQKTSVFSERVAMIEHAKNLIPEPLIVTELVDAFQLRCHHLAGHIIHIPSLLSDIELFNTSTTAEIITSHLNMFDLARYLMVLRLGMRFYPWRGGMFADHTKPGFIAVNALKNQGGEISNQWLDLAKKALSVDKHFSLDSLTAIQAALLMILDGRDSPQYLRLVLRLSIQTALDMGLHRLGKAEPFPDSPDENLVRVETGVRIWWYLVVKDWCSSQREGAYTIHPAQMTTRKPLHTTDERLSENNMDEIPLGEHTEMSYVLSQIMLAHTVRDSIDLRNEQSKIGGSYSIMSATNRKLMQLKLEAFLTEDLPEFYRLGACGMKPGIMAVQRCLLHQQTFDFLLKLNRRDMASHAGRASSAVLAEQIISTQKLLRSVCPVIDGFWVNFLHLFGATLTLTISLLLEERLDEETRQKRKERVHEALGAMRETPGSTRGSLIIEALLQEEERRWQTRMTSWSEPDLTLLTKQLTAKTSSLASVSSMSGLVDRSAPLPEESIIPALSAPWGEDPCDPMGLIGELNQAPKSLPFHLADEPAGPGPSVLRRNMFYDWALHHGGMHLPQPPPPPPPP